MHTISSCAACIFHTECTQPFLHVLCEVRSYVLWRITHYCLVAIIMTMGSNSLQIFTYFCTSLQVNIIFCVFQCLNTANPFVSLFYKSLYLRRASNVKTARVSFIFSLCKHLSPSCFERLNFDYSLDIDTRMIKNFG